jgi:hypothetical protein
MSKEVKVNLKAKAEGFKEAQDSVDNLGNSANKFEGLSGKLDKLGNSVGQLPGPVGNATKSFTDLGKQLLQLLKNPVVLVITGLVVAFKTLYEALKSTEEGQDRLNKITGIFKAIISPVVKIVQDFAIFLADKFIVVLEQVANLFGIAGDEASSLADSIKEVNDAEDELAVKRAKQNKDLAETKEILNDTTKSVDERRKALKKVQDAETELAAEQVRINKKKIDNIKEEIKRDGESKELKDKLKEATIGQIDAEADLSNKKLQFSKVSKALDKEEQANAKAKSDKAKEIAKERKALLDQELKDRIEIAKKIRALEDKAELDAIDNERDRAIKQLQFQKRDALVELNESKANAKEKAKIKKLIDEEYIRDSQKIYKDAAIKDAEAAKALLLKQEQEAKDRQKAEEEAIDMKYAKRKLASTKAINNEKDLQDTLAQDEKNRLYDILVYRKSIGAETLDIEQKIAEFRQAENAKQIANEEALLEKKKQQMASSLDATKQFFGAVATIAGESSKAATAAAIGTAIIDTYVAANKALKSDVPFPFNFILMASTLVTGFANVKKIYDEASKMGAETGGGSVGGASAGPSISIAGGQVDNATQLSKSVGNAVNRPTKAYVVGNDVNSQQSLDRRITQNATLGG